MDGYSLEQFEMAKVDIATEADKLLLQINKFVEGNPGKRIDRNAFHKAINFDQKTQEQQQVIKYLLEEYLFEYKKFGYVRKLL